MVSLWASARLGKQIPGVAEFDFPKRQTPRHPIQIPISVPRTRHTRITAIWLGHARPLFQLRNPRLSHLWCLHSWKSLLEKSVQWCLTGHVLSILANWKAVFCNSLGSTAQSATVLHALCLTQNVFAVYTKHKHHIPKRDTETALSILL